MSPRANMNTGFRFDSKRNLHFMEKALDDHPGWKVVVGVEVDDDQPAIVEVTITRWHPVADFFRRTGGTVTYHGPPVRHSRRVTTAMLRSVSLTDVTEAANVWLAGKQLGRLPNPRKGRVRDDRYYAVWAAHYIKLLQNGSRSPIKDLAEKYDLPREQVRDLIHQARVRKLLPPSTGGVADGHLTAKALGLLPAT